MNPFDFVKSITYTKQDIMHDLNESEYEPFLINRALSYYQDCILYANEMNRLYSLSKHAQFSFLLNTIRPKKRFSKWLKASRLANLELVKQYYGYTNEKAKQALELLTKKEIEFIKEKLFKGGKK